MDETYKLNYDLIFPALPKIIGGFLLILGLVVLFGWHSGNSALVFIHSSFVAMQYNTALGFILGGIGLLSKGFNWREVGIVSAGLLIALSATILADYLFAIDLGITALFISHPSVSQAAFIDRMSVISATCLLLTGAGIILSFFAEERKLFQVLIGVMSVVILAFGIVAVIGYIGGWDSAYGRSQNIGVAIHTATGLIFASFGLFAAGVGASTWAETWPRWLSGVVATAMIILSISLWQEIRNDYAEGIRRVLAEQAALLRDDIPAARATAMRSLSHMADRWDRRGGTPREEWRRDAGNYLADQQGLRAVGWIDGGSGARWIETADKADGFNFLDLMEKYTPSAVGNVETWNTGDVLGRAVVQVISPEELDGTGAGFLAYFPLNDGGAAQGFIVGMFDMVALVRSILPKTFTANYGLSLNFRGKEFYIQDDPGRAYVDQWSYAGAATFHGINWRFSIWPKPSKLAADYSILPETVLIAGTLMGILMALSLNYALTLRVLSARVARSEKRLGLILGNAGEAIFGLDRQGRTTFLNKAAETLLGYSAAEMIGRTPHALPHHHSDRSKYPVSSRGIREALESGVPCSSAEEIFWTKKGGTILVEYTSQPIYDDNGNIAGAVVAFRDIAERKAAEAERDRLIAMLTRSNEELDGFAHIASHDLKEPLRAIHNHSRFLLEDYEDKIDETGVKRLNRLGYLTQRMERLINELLNFSRLGREELSIRQTDLNEVVADIKGTLREKLWEQNASVIIPRSLPTIECDTVRVTELFRNLIENGLKYNESSAKCIEIGCENPSNPVFYVKDNGIGIESEFHNDIFRIFKRLHSEKQYAGGTGAGLTFVKRIVEQHSGKIWLNSRKGGGTTFHFTLKGGTG